MSEGKLRYIASSMDAKLPYPLTKGVIATREGLIVEVLSDAWRVLQGSIDLTQLDLLVLAAPWPDAAERLRYREGEPWCAEGDYDEIVCVRGSALPPEYALHRLAAILCDDAEAFRVLHWCVSHLAQEDSK